MKNFPLMTFVFFSICLVMCSKKKTNNSIYEAAKASDLQYYKGKDSLYSPGGGSPHGTFKLKFNSKSIEQFGPDGKFPSGTFFKDGSTIIKEVYANGNLTTYAVMKKDSKSKFASYGWIWSECKPDGEIIYDVSKNGLDCVPCHNSNTNRDLTRSFDVH